MTVQRPVQIVFFQVLFPARSEQVQHPAKRKTRNIHVSHGASKPSFTTAAGVYVTRRFVRNNASLISEKTPRRIRKTNLPEREYFENIRVRSWVTRPIRFVVRS